MDCSMFQTALSLLLDSSYDANLPKDDLLLRLAGAAIGFGLQVGSAYPERVDRLLFPDDHWLVLSFVEAFAAGAVQERISRTAAEANSPLVTVAVMLALQSYIDVAGEADPAKLYAYSRDLSRFCLRFSLMLWSLHPSVAEAYRRVLPV